MYTQQNTYTYLLTHHPPAFQQQPTGFGIAAQPTEYCKDLDAGANVVLHQGDVGEYLRVEDELS